MKLVIFGATGLTGIEVVKQALALGHHVTAIVRNPDKMGIEHDQLQVFKGDVYDVETFSSVLSGKDAVISCLGSKNTKGPFAVTTLYSDTIKPIIEAMKRNDVTRLVVMTAWCTKPGPNNPWFIEWFLKPFIIGANLRDMAVMENILEATPVSEMNYTVVKMPGLTLAEGNKNYDIVEGQCNVGTQNYIPRADVAHFILSALETDKYDRKEMAIATKL